MKPEDRVGELLVDLEQTLQSAEELVSRGRPHFDSDPAMPLAFEALSNRVGEVAKLLTQLAPHRFSEPMWSLAAKNRDKIVHHYNTIDKDVLWSTVAISFPQLRELANSKRSL